MTKIVQLNMTHVFIMFELGISDDDGQQITVARTHCTTQYQQQQIVIVFFFARPTLYLLTLCLSLSLSFYICVCVRLILPQPFRNTLELKLRPHI